MKNIYRTCVWHLHCLLHEVIVDSNDRPYSKDTGYDESDISALLSVRLVSSCTRLWYSIGSFIFTTKQKFTKTQLKEKMKSRKHNLSSLMTRHPFIRFLSGYPNKCPKLRIIPEKGLSVVDVDNLLSLLHDQVRCIPVQKHSLHDSW